MGRSYPCPSSDHGYKVPSNYIKKILWMCFASLNVDDVNLRDFIPRKDLGKNKKKGDNFGSFVCLSYFWFVKPQVEDV